MRWVEECEPSEEEFRKMSQFLNFIDGKKRPACELLGENDQGWWKVLSNPVG